MTCDIWGWTFYKNFSFLAFMVCLEDSELNDDSMNELMNKSINDKGVHRTAPATQGLLNSQ